MSVIAVVNRKGGSGKSTLATNLAWYLAAQGLDVMLGDVDRQQSSRLWLSLRPESRPKILGWTIDDRNFARPPAGVKHVVLDTPGGFQGVGLMKVAMYADAVLIPATHSLFDRQAAAECLKELRILPRVATGKCRIASVGMRIDGRTKNAALLEAWAGRAGRQSPGFDQGSAGLRALPRAGLVDIRLSGAKGRNLPAGVGADHRLGRPNPGLRAARADPRRAGAAAPGRTHPAARAGVFARASVARCRRVTTGSGGTKAKHRRQWAPPRPIHRNPFLRVRESSENAGSPGKDSGPQVPARGHHFQLDPNNQDPRGPLDNPA